MRCDLCGTSVEACLAVRIDIWKGTRKWVYLGHRPCVEGLYESLGGTAACVNG
jgi:hypothetical protein